MLYISWVLSPSQEGDNGKDNETATVHALNNWKHVGMPLLFLCYVMLLAAIVLMFFAHSYSMWFNDPFQWDAGKIYGSAGSYPILLYVTFVLFLVGSIAAFYWSTKVGARKSLTNQHV